MSGANFAGTDRRNNKAGAPQCNFAIRRANGLNPCYTVFITPIRSGSPAQDRANFRLSFAGYTLPKEKKEGRHLGTFGDIWGHMSHFHATTRRFLPHKAKPPDIRNLMFTSMQIVGPADARTGTDLGD